MYLGLFSLIRFDSRISASTSLPVMVQLMSRIFSTKAVVLASFVPLK